jgi:hypothetical protein
MARRHTIVKLITKKEMDGFITDYELMDFMEQVFLETFIDHGIIKTYVNNNGEKLYSGDCVRRLINTLIASQNKKCIK